MLGKINNKQDAEDEYVKKIKEDEDYLNSINSTNNLFLRLKIILKKQNMQSLAFFSHQKKGQNKQSQKIHQ